MVLIGGRGQAEQALIGVVRDEKEALEEIRDQLVGGREAAEDDEVVARYFDQLGMSLHRIIVAIEELEARQLGMRG